MERYLSLRQKKTTALTFVSDKSNLLRVEAYLGAALKLRRLGPEHIERLFYDERSPFGDLAPGSWNVAKARVSAFATHLERRGLAKPGLMGLVDSKRVVSRERFRLSPRQLLALPDMATHPRDQALLCTAVHTALRRSDLTSLRVGDVDLAAGRLHVMVAKSQVEDRKPISAELDRSLRTWLTAYTVETGPPQSDWFLFPGRTEVPSPKLVPTRPLSTQSGYRLIRPLLQQLGCEAQDGWHTIRRSTARAYFDSLRGQGFDHALLATAALLNHANVATTLKYLGLSREKQVLDDTMLGKGWLSAMVPDEGVVQLRARG